MPPPYTAPPPIVPPSAKSLSSAQKIVKVHSPSLSLALPAAHDYQVYFPPTPLMVMLATLTDFGQQQ